MQHQDLHVIELGDIEDETLTFTTFMNVAVSRPTVCKDSRVHALAFLSQLLFDVE